MHFPCLYTYYHYSHRKIPVLMVLTIEAWEAICLHHDCLKSEFCILFLEFDCIWAQKRPCKVKAFMCTCKLFYANHKNMHKMRVWNG